MAAVVHIEMEGPVEGSDLIESLARRGLTGELVLADDRWEIEIRYEREEEARLMREVTVALESWLSDRGFDSIALRPTEGRNTLEPHPHLEEAPLLRGLAAPTRV